jgi:hypothetical protein
MILSAQHVGWAGWILAAIYKLDLVVLARRRVRASERYRIRSKFRQPACSAAVALWDHSTDDSGGSRAPERCPPGYRDATRHAGGTSARDSARADRSATDGSSTDQSTTNCSHAGSTGFNAIRSHAGCAGCNTSRSHSGTLYCSDCAGQYVDDNHSAAARLCQKR